MSRIAALTSMGSFRERFLGSQSAFRTRLRRWGKESILNKLSSSTFSLVGQHVEELAPACVCNMFSKTTVFEHSVDVERLDSYEAVSLGDCATGLVEEVRPLVSDMNMASGNLMNSLPSVRRASFLPAQSSLELLEFSLRFDKEAWIGDRFASA